MKRLLALLVAAHGSWLGAGGSAPAIAMPPNLQCAPVYAYVGCFVSTSTNTAFEGAPSKPLHYATRSGAVDRSSHGVSTCPAGATLSEVSIYDDPWCSGATTGPRLRRVATLGSPWGNSRRWRCPLLP